MPRILLITFFFPPDHVIPHRRSYRTAKVVAESGWVVDVITAEVGAPRCSGLTAPMQDEFQDWEHVKSLPESVSVYRTPVGPCRWVGTPSAPGCLGRVLRGRWGRLLAWPDPFILWGLYAIREGRRLLAANTYDVILTNSYPYTSHLVGQVLRRKCRLPWVVDLRDPWAIPGNQQFDWLTPVRWHRSMHRKWMDGIMRQASSIWNLTPGINRRFVQRYSGKMPTGKFVCVPIGADMSVDAGVPNPLPTTNTFDIVYAGTFREKHYPSTGLMSALRTLREQRPELAERLRVRVYGREAFNLRTAETVREEGLEGMFTFGSLVGESDLMAILRGSTCQLLLGGTNEWSRLRYSGKLFDYLASGRPIIAVTPVESAIADVVRETDCGWVVPPDRPEAIVDRLIKCIETWNKTGQLNITPRIDGLRRYSLQDGVTPVMLAELKRVGVV